MRIKVKVHASSSQEKIVCLGEGSYVVWIKEKPFEGKANTYLAKFLKKELKKKYELVAGFKSKLKTFEEIS